MCGSSGGVSVCADGDWTPCSEQMDSCLIIHEKGCEEVWGIWRECHRDPIGLAMSLEVDRTRKGQNGKYLSQFSWSAGVFPHPSLFESLLPVCSRAPSRSHPGASELVAYCWTPYSVPTCMLHANPSSICPGSSSRTSQAHYLLLQGTGTLFSFLQRIVFKSRCPLRWQSRPLTKNSHRCPWVWCLHRTHTHPPVDFKSFLV